MQLHLFNDARRMIRIHPATEVHGVGYSQPVIRPLCTATFEVPDGATPWLKLWDHGEQGLMLLVSVVGATIDTVGVGRTV